MFGELVIVRLGVVLALVTASALGANLAPEAKGWLAAEAMVAIMGAITAFCYLAEVEFSPPQESRLLKKYFWSSSAVTVAGVAAFTATLTGSIGIGIAVGVAAALVGGAVLTR